ncbi:MAG: hypothetical protein V7631_4424 [Massilia sp.]|jgi:predicted small secreted protein
MRRSSRTLTAVAVASLLLAACGTPSPTGQQAARGERGAEFVKLVRMAESLDKAGAAGQP